MAPVARAVGIMCAFLFGAGVVSWFIVGAASTAVPVDDAFLPDAGGDDPPASAQPVAEADADKPCSASSVRCLDQRHDGAVTSLLVLTVVGSLMGLVLRWTRD